MIKSIFTVVLDSLAPGSYVLSWWNASMIHSRKVVVPINITYLGPMYGLPCNTLGICQWSLVVDIHVPLIVCYIKVSVKSNRRKPTLLRTQNKIPTSKEKSNQHTDSSTLSWAGFQVQEHTHTHKDSQHTVTHIRCSCPYVRYQTYVVAQPTSAS